MRKYILLLVFFGLSIAQSFGQVSNQGPIDSLRRLIPAVKDSAKVDRLNDLCKAIVFGYGFNEPGFTTRGDSVIKYADLAYLEAGKIGYKYGMAMALINLALGQRLLPTDSK